MTELGAISAGTIGTVAYGYPSGYKPTPIEELIIRIADTWGVRKRRALKIAKGLKGSIPEGTELSAFPYFPAIGRKYSSAANIFIREFEKQGKVHSSIRPELTETQVRRHKKTNNKLKELARQQKSDILVVPVQMGLRYGGFSATTAEERFSDKEFGLGMFEIGCILLADPNNRLQSPIDLRIDCVSDHLREGRKSFMPCFGIDQQGNLVLSQHSPRSASCQYGAATGFMI